MLYLRRRVYDYEGIDFSANILPLYYGLHDGFSIQVFAGDPGNVSLIGAPERLIEMPRVYPNPSTGATVQVEWKGPSQGPVALGVYDMIGNEVQREVINRQSADAVFTIQHDLAPGL